MVPSIQLCILENALLDVVHRTLLSNSNGLSATHSEGVKKILLSHGVSTLGSNSRQSMHFEQK